MTEVRRTGLSCEWTAFRLGLRAALRLTASAAELPGVQLWLDDLGLEHVSTALSGGDRRVIYVARDATVAEELRNAESLVLPGGPPRPPDERTFEAHRRVGKQLGYPSCCVEAFVQRVAHDVTRLPNGARAHETFVFVTIANSRSERLDWHLNAVAIERDAMLIPFQPCRFDCPAALELATAVHAEIARGAAERAERMRGALAKAVAVDRDGGCHPPNFAPPGSLVLAFA